jgi:hypothetical protein
VREVKNQTRKGRKGTGNDRWEIRVRKREKIKMREEERKKDRKKKQNKKQTAERSGRGKEAREEQPGEESPAAGRPRRWTGAGRLKVN